MRFSRSLFAVLVLSAACSDEDTPDVGPVDSGIVDSGPSDTGTASDAGGVLIGRVRVSRDTIDFGPVVITSTASATFTLSNPEADPVRVTLSQPIGLAADRFSRTLNVPDEEGVFTIEAAGTITVTVRVSPVSEDPLIAMLALDSCLGACPSAVLLLAEGALTGVSCPETVDLGLVNPDTCITAIVQCENRGNATERITAVELEVTSDPEMTLSPYPLPAALSPNDTIDLEVEYCPTSVETNNGELLVFTFLPFETEHRILLTGAGGGADISCEPMIMDFGTIGVGATVEQTITCSNDGYDVATLDLHLVTADEFQLTSTAAVQLGAGESTEIEITASPTSVGSKADLLQMTTNDPDAPEIAIPLLADAIQVDPCSATLEPTSVSFGLINIGDARRAELSVLNTGTTDCLVRQVMISRDSNPDFTVAAAPPSGTILGPGLSASVTVEYAPSANAFATGRVLVSFSNPGTTELSADLEGVGGFTPVVVHPGSINFGPTPMGCGAPTTRRISMRNLAAAGGSVTNIQVVGASDFGLNVTQLPLILAFFETLDFDVTFDPTTTGLQTAEVRIYAAGQPTPVIVPIVGEGQATAAHTDQHNSNPKTVDLLFVVDNSGSMGMAQDALAQFAHIVTDAMLHRAADVHIGVVTTDMEEVAESGRLLGSPSFLSAATPNVAAELVTRLTPGITGSGNEQGIAAAVAALTPPLSTADNIGFRRVDADLAVIIVSDENDFSPSPPSVARQSATLRQIAGNGRLILGGIVAPADGDCNGPFGLGQAAPRYRELIARADSNVLLSYCDNMADNLQRIADAVFGGLSFVLSTRPVISTITANVNGTPVPASSWAYELVSNSVFFFDSATVPAGVSVELAYDAFCLSPTCENGTMESGEQCDDNNSATDDACIECLDALCGDGLVQTNVEACDDGNLIVTDACLPTCEIAECGDGFLQWGVETCDDGNTLPGDGCPSNCSFYGTPTITSTVFTPLSNPTPIVPGGGSDPNDDGFAEVYLPFVFSLYDVPSSTIAINVNGFLSTLPGSAGGYTNTAIPSGSPPDGLIAGWWDDLYLDPTVPGGASMGYTIRGAAPNRVAVFEWLGMRRYNHTSSDNRLFNFQIALAEGSNIVRLIYGETHITGTVPNATSASAGIEDQTGTMGVEVLGCSPNCSGSPRPQIADGFPEHQVVTISP